jgi:hypothetical protein
VTTVPAFPLGGYMLPIGYVDWQERQMSQDGSNADKRPPQSSHDIPVALIGAIAAIVAALIACSSLAAPFCFLVGEVVGRTR